MIHAAKAVGAAIRNPSWRPPTSAGAGDAPAAARAVVPPADVPEGAVTERIRIRLVLERHLGERALVPYKEECPRFEPATAHFDEAPASTRFRRGHLCPALLAGCPVSRRRQHRVIALWLGHADTGSTQQYIHADMTIKERALALLTPPTARPGRYRPTDEVLAYLDSLG